MPMDYGWPQAFRSKGASRSGDFSESERVGKNPADSAMKTRIPIRLAGKAMPKLRQGSAWFLGEHGDESQAVATA